MSVCIATGNGTSSTRAEPKSQKTGSQPLGFALDGRQLTTSLVFRQIPDQIRRALQDTCEMIEWRSQNAKVLRFAQDHRSSLCLEFLASTLATDLCLSAKISSVTLPIRLLAVDI